MSRAEVRVFLIEDDPDYVHLFKVLLREAADSSSIFSVESRDRLESGLSWLSKSRYDVVLLDLMLPDSAGIETLKRVRAALDTPIVVLTSLDDEEIALAAVRAGAQDYLLKGSIDAIQLKRTIRYAMERSRLLGGLESILKNAADGMAVVEDGIVRYVNAAALVLLGKKAEEMVGKPFGYPIRPNHETELKLQGPQGDRVLEMRTTELEWRQSRATLATMRDITELKRIEQLKAEIKERRRIDQLKDQFMSAVSHELRSPLTIVKAAVGNLKEGLAGALSESQAVMVGLAYKNVERLARLLNNILDLSRLESGMARINRRRINAARLIADAIQGFQLAGQDKGLVLTAEIQADLPPVYADEDMLTQVLNNLLDNALRFARKTIRIQARAVETAELPASSESGKSVAGACARKKAVQVSVIDDGSGIPPENLEKLFKKFVQLDRAPGGGGYKGTGLGLSLCKEIVERNNGRIWVESAVNKGASFHFILPQYAE